jgi:hypothetical protein
MRCLPLAALLAASALQAQEPSEPWRLSAGIGPAYGRALGTMATYLAGAGGLDAHLVATRGGTWALRVDAGLLTFAQRVVERPLGGPASPVILIGTGSRIALVTVGPARSLGHGRVAVMAHAAAGIAQYNNTGALDLGGDPQRFRRSDVYGTFTWAATGGASVRYSVSDASALELSGRLVHTGEAPYLREGNLPVGVISGVYLYPKPYAPTLVMFGLGVTTRI